MELWRNYLSAGISNQGDIALLRKAKFITGFSLLGILTLLIFGTLNVIDGKTSTGIVEFSFGVLLVINVIIFRNIRNVIFASSVMSLSVLIPLIYLLFSGGIGNSGILWFFTFPTVTYLLMGKKWGTIWMGILFLAIIGVMTQYPILGFEPAYTSTEIRQLLISLVVVASLIYLYQDTIENTQSRLVEQNKQLEDARIEAEQNNNELLNVQNELKEANSSLEQKVHERTAELESLKKGLEGEVATDTQKLEEKIEQLEKLNKYMVDRELRMVELKAENVSLKKQLGKELLHEQKD